MNPFKRPQFFLWYFGRFKIPMIGFLRPKLLKLTDKEIVLRLPFNKRSKNHLNSMYFGALAVGADLAGGWHGMYHANKLHYKVSLAFKSFQAQFLSRPESDVFFVSLMGDEVKAMLEESKTTGLRVNKPVIIKAYTHYLTEPKEVADFVLELSIKVL